MFGEWTQGSKDGLSTCKDSSGKDTLDPNPNSSGLHSVGLASPSSEEPSTTEDRIS